MVAIDCKPMVALLVLLLSISFNNGQSSKCKDNKPKRWCYERLHLAYNPLKQRTVFSQCRKVLKACKAPDCPPGFMLSKKYECEDIDECSEPELNDCGMNAICINTEGSFICKCPADKPLGDPRQKCVAPNPCDDGTHSCPTEATCIKVWDTYRCLCPEGQMDVYLEKTCKHECHNKVVCKVWGDPHYVTYDTKKMDHQGNCTYTLSSTVCPPHITPLPADMKHFNINIKNHYLKKKKKATFLHYLDISFRDDNIRIYVNNTVIINGKLTSLPYHSDDDSYMIFVKDKDAFLLVPFGLTVTVMHDNAARIYIDEKYKEHVCGICGNADGDKKTDMITKEGTKASSATELCRSWVVDDGVESCTDDGPPECDPAIRSKAAERCSKITEDPFAACNEKVPTEDIVNGCVYDLCALVDNLDNQDDLVHSTVCAAYKNYADECLLKGTLVEWDKDGLCANYPQCPKNGVYKHNITCSPTCADPNGEFSCSGVPSGGCQCQDGFVEETGEELRCIDKHACGCTHQGVYHKLHNTWVNKDCYVKYKCLHPKQIVSWPIDCDAELHYCRSGTQEHSGCFCTEKGNVPCDVPESDPSAVPDDNYDPTSC